LEEAVRELVKLAKSHPKRSILLLLILSATLIAVTYLEHRNSPKPTNNINSTGSQNVNANENDGTIQQDNK